MRSQSRPRNKHWKDREDVGYAIADLHRTPDAVIDVGVRYGTKWLYDVFKDAPFILIDPQDEGEAILTSRPERYVFVNKAVGREPGTLMLNEQRARSTLLKRTPLTATRTFRRYDVDVTTLDAVIDEHAPDARRIGLKIDTEGFEMDVLAGLASHWDCIDFILSEVSVLNRFEESYNFSELICELWSKGFRFYNFVDIACWPVPPVYDCLFFRKDDPIFG